MDMTCLCLLHATNIVAPCMAKILWSAEGHGLVYLLSRAGNVAQDNEAAHQLVLGNGTNHTPVLRLFEASKLYQSRSGRS